MDNIIDTFNINKEIIEKEDIFQINRNENIDDEINNLDIVLKKKN